MKAKLTYKLARAIIISHLKEHGWDVRTWNSNKMKPMVNPWADNGEIRYYFKTQTVYKTRSKGLMANASSTAIDLKDWASRIQIHQMKKGLQNDLSKQGNKRNNNYRHDLNQFQR